MPHQILAVTFKEIADPVNQLYWSRISTDKETSNVLRKMADQDLIVHSQDLRLLRRHTIKTKVCKVCHGGLVQKRMDGRDVVVCAANPAHEGFIGKSQALTLERQRRRDASEVLRNYPQFNPPSATETAQQSIDLLWGPERR